MNDSFAHRRSIRSFVIREGRITRAQQAALDTAWPQFGLAYQDTPIDLNTVFERSDLPVTLEIGFGDGEALAQIAAQNPEHNFVGIEVHRPGVGYLLIRAQECQLPNLKIINHDAVDVMENMLSSNSLARVNIYFPDPWPKKRHHKRRLIQTPFVDLLARRISSGGTLHLATDWQPYAEHMVEVLTPHQEFKTESTSTELEQISVRRPDYRPSTKFERRGEKKGHGVWDLIYNRR